MNLRSPCLIIVRSVRWGAQAAVSGGVTCGAATEAGALGAAGAVAAADGALAATGALARDGRRRRPRGAVMARGETAGVGAARFARTLGRVGRLRAARRATTARVRARAARRTLRCFTFLRRIGVRSACGLATASGD